MQTYMYTYNIHTYTIDIHLNKIQMKVYDTPIISNGDL